MGNIVKLVFHSIATGSGLSKMYGEVKGLASAMPGLSKATMILGQAFGTVGASVGRMATMLLQGGIWGAAAEGVRLVVDQLGLFKDKSEENKKELDELKAATEKYYQAINDNYEKAKGKIDKETDARKAQIEITNRMIKAELQLRRAKALASGDVGTANSIQEEIENQDSRSAIDKSELDVNKAIVRKGEAELHLKKVLEKSEEARHKFEEAEQKALKSQEDQAKFMNANAASRGSYARYKASDFSPGKVEQEELNAAYALRDEAKKQLDAAKAAVAEERRKLQLARQSLEVLKKEQEAAEAKAKAEKDAAEADKKAAEKKAKEDADTKFLKEARELQIKHENEERERKKKQAKDEADEKKKKLREFEAERVREEMRTNRATAANYEQTLTDAVQRVADKRDILANAAGMDQAADIQSASQKKHVEERFAKRSEALQKRLAKVGGEPAKLGRLSNIDKATLDRMQAEKVRDSATEELKKLNQKFDNLTQQLKEQTQL